MEQAAADSLGQQVLQRIVALKAARGKVTEKVFWAEYRILRACFYATPDWIALSALVRREHPYCSRSKRHKTLLHAHHKIHLFDDPTLGLDRNNLEVICKRCHKKEHNGNK